MSEPVSNSESAADLAVVRPSRTPLIVGGLVVLVVLLAVGVVVSGRTPKDEKEIAAGQKTPPAVAPPAGTPPAVAPLPPDPVRVVATSVKLTLETTPSHAEVYEEDVLLGATPLTISRPPGTVTGLRFEAKGFQPLTRKVRFESDTTLPLELEKEVAKGKKPPRVRPPSEGDLMDLPE